jgi:hypothetical protein
LRRHAHHDVAAAVLERVADETLPLCPPRIGDLLAELCADKLSQLVLETFARLIGERKIVGVSAHS